MSNITVTITDTDKKILENDLLDISQWVEDALQGKIDSCWSRMRSEWTNRLMNDPSFTDPIPSNKADFVNLVTALPQYKNRMQRDTNDSL